MPRNNGSLSNKRKPIEKSVTQEGNVTITQWNRHGIDHFVYSANGASIHINSDGHTIFEAPKADGVWHIKSGSNDRREPDVFVKDGDSGFEIEDIYGSYTFGRRGDAGTSYSPQIDCNHDVTGDWGNDQDITVFTANQIVATALHDFANKHPELVEAAASNTQKLDGLNSKDLPLREILDMRSHLKGCPQELAGHGIMVQELDSVSVYEAPSAPSASPNCAPEKAGQCK